MQVRLKKPWGMRPAGSILDVSEGVADLWIKQGRCETMVPPQVVEIAIESTVDRRQPRRRERTTA